MVGVMGSRLGALQARGGKAPPMGQRSYAAHMAHAGAGPVLTPALYSYGVLLSFMNLGLMAAVLFWHSGFLDLSSAWLDRASAAGAFSGSLPPFSLAKRLKRQYAPWLVERERHWDRGTGAVGVCMTGEMRDFEITGPSFVARFLTAYPDTHYFISSYLTEASYKLHTLAFAPANISIAAVQHVQQTMLDETVLRGKDLTRSDNQQRLMQMFRVIEACVPMMRTYEDKHGLRFSWVVRTRPDFFWAAPPPPLRQLSRRALSVPYGMDCVGLNDRFGIGPWRTQWPALGRLLLTRYLPQGWWASNAEFFYLKSLEWFRVKYVRQDFPFCLVSRQRYPAKNMPIASLDTAFPLNGCKCQPCTAWLVKEKAAEYLANTTEYCRMEHEERVEDLRLCDPTVPWEPGWEAIFDAVAGPALSAERRKIMDASLGECMKNMKKLKERTDLWISPSSYALCMRKHLGKRELVGAAGESYNTVLEWLKNIPNPLRLAVVSGSRAFHSWEHQMEKVHNRTLRSNTYNTFQSLMNDKSVQEPFHFLRSDIKGSALVDEIASWGDGSKSPRACILMLPFDFSTGVRGGWLIKDTKQIVRALEGAQFPLISCVKSGRDLTQRCTFFSTLHCRQFLGNV